jgi:hypothetical protein
MGSRGPKPGDTGYRPPRSPKERILARVSVDANGCWVWGGTTNPKGYAATFFGSRIDGTRKTHAVHRVAYEAWIGPIPDGLTIDHLCENKACVNPQHLEPVTNRENCRRRGERMTTCKRGHPRTPENTRVNPNGKKQCRVCIRITSAARRASLKEAA